MRQQERLQWQLQLPVRVKVETKRLPEDQNREPGLSYCCYHCHDGDDDADEVRLHGIGNFLHRYRQRNQSSRDVNRDRVVHDPRHFHLPHRHGMNRSMRLDNRKSIHLYSLYHLQFTRKIKYFLDQMLLVYIHTSGPTATSSTKPIRLPLTAVSSYKIYQ